MHKIFAQKISVPWPQANNSQRSGRSVLLTRGRSSVWLPVQTAHGTGKTAGPAGPAAQRLRVSFSPVKN